MKKIFVCLAILLFSFAAASQVNRHAGKIKRKGIKELQLFENQNDSVPSSYIYYDRRGRVTKLISMSLAGDSPLTWKINSVEYDSLGREFKRYTNHSHRPVPDKENYFVADDELKLYIYKGDSVIETIDSTWNDTGLVEARYKKHVGHFKKNLFSGFKKATPETFWVSLYYDWDIRYAKKYFGKGKIETVYW